MEQVSRFYTKRKEIQDVDMCLVGNMMSTGTYTDTRSHGCLFIFG